MGLAFTYSEHEGHHSCNPQLVQCERRSRQWLFYRGAVLFNCFPQLNSLWTELLCQCRCTVSGSPRGIVARMQSPSNCSEQLWLMLPSSTSQAGIARPHITFSGSSSSLVEVAQLPHCMQTTHMKHLIDCGLCSVHSNKHCYWRIYCSLSDL